MAHPQQIIQWFMKLQIQTYDKYCGYEITLSKLKELWSNSFVLEGGNENAKCEIMLTQKISAMAYQVLCHTAYILLNYEMLQKGSV